MEADAAINIVILQIRGQITCLSSPNWYVELLRTFTLLYFYPHSTPLVASPIYR